MKRRRLYTWLCCALIVPGCLMGLPVQAIELAQSQLQHDQNRLRYGLVTQTNGDIASFSADQEYLGDDVDAPLPGQKSPAKAFVLSLLVPGAGQLYAGSRIRPFVYLGVEAAAWGLHAKYHSSGNEKTDDFEAFNQAHWSRSDYATYLTWTYGNSDDTMIDVGTYVEFTHHLPSTNTQQFYEMTGKYDQFAWGWDDARYKDSTLAMFDASNPPPRFIYPDSVPHSSNRDAYETMRDLANKEFNKATKMLMLALANHVVSAFEAFITTKAHNRAVEEDAAGGDKGSFLSKLKVKPSLKSIYSKRDTPYVKVTYKF